MTPLPVVYIGHAASGSRSKRIASKHQALIRRIVKAASLNHNWIVKTGPYATVGPYDAYLMLQVPLALSEISAVTSQISRTGGAVSGHLSKLGFIIDDYDQVLGCGGIPIELVRFFHIDSPLFAQEIDGWLEGLLGKHGGPRPATDRALIESLHLRIQLGVIENEELKRYIAQLQADFHYVQGELSEAQIEIRTLKAVLDQVEKHNAALLLELSKGRVDPVSASLTVRALKYLVPYVLTGFITAGSTYAGTVAAMPDAQAKQLDTTSQIIVQDCNQVIVALDEGG
ncbi:MAG TPA: hypothetical protein VEW93_06925 [Acidimicrobiales bacterium]|nr:hypothetical protein [Acidimicrobiales bacterium]